MGRSGPMDGPLGRNMGPPFQQGPPSQSGPRPSGSAGSYICVRLELFLYVERFQRFLTVTEFFYIFQILI